MALALAWTTFAPAAARETLAQPADLASLFERDVALRLQVPAAVQAGYRQQLLDALADARVVVDRAQFAVLIDRSRHVQAAMVWWLLPGGQAGLVGAAPASTGRPGRFEHFETPLGVFEHSLAHPDYRAEGTRNALGIRGYGERGMRVYDFGWVVAARGWTSGEQPMRLQMHATDPQRLEPRLGQRESKGCIRIPAALNRLIDRYGVLDAAYDEALAMGRQLWVLRRDRVATPWSGRWLVVVESAATERPAWSPPPLAKQRPVRPVGQAEAEGRDEASPPPRAEVAGPGEDPRSFSCVRRSV